MGRIDDMNVVKVKDPEYMYKYGKQDKKGREYYGYDCEERES